MVYAIVDMDEAQARALAWAMAVAAQLAVRSNVMTHAAAWLEKEAENILGQIQADRLIADNQGCVAAGGAA